MYYEVFAVTLNDINGRLTPGDWMLLSKKTDLHSAMVDVDKFNRIVDGRKVQKILARDAQTGEIVYRVFPSR